MGEYMGKTHARLCISIHSNIICRVILRLHDESGHLVAHSLLPYKFIVTANGKQKAAVVDYGTPAHTASRQPTIQPELHVPNPSPAHVPVIQSPDPLTNFHPGPVDQHSNIASVLHRLAPSEGPVSGGPIILLSGTDFPSRPTIYARFGTVVVPTV